MIVSAQNLVSSRSVKPRPTTPRIAPVSSAKLGWGTNGHVLQKMQVFAVAYINVKSGDTVKNTAILGPLCCATACGPIRQYRSKAIASLAGKTEIITAPIDLLRVEDPCSCRSSDCQRSGWRSGDRRRLQPYCVYPRGQLEVNIEGFAGRNLAVTSGRHSQRIISRCYFRDWGLILVGYYFQAHHFKFIGRIERIHRPVVKLNYSAAPGDVAWIGPNTHRMLLRRKHGSV